MALKYCSVAGHPHLLSTKDTPATTFATSFLTLGLSFARSHPCKLWDFGQARLLTTSVPSSLGKGTFLHVAPIHATQHPVSIFPFSHFLLAVYQFDRRPIDTGSSSSSLGCFAVTAGLFVRTLRAAGQCIQGSLRRRRLSNVLGFLLFTWPGVDLRFRGKAQGGLPHI